jgi:hypothetical protein
VGKATKKMRLCLAPRILKNEYYKKALLQLFSNANDSKAKGEIITSNFLSRIDTLLPNTQLGFALVLHISFLAHGFMNQEKSTMGYYCSYKGGLTIQFEVISCYGLQQQVCSLPFL